MSAKPYISSRTRDAALRAVEDLPTDVLLDSMRQMPISDYRRTEFEQSYAQDLAEHRKVFGQSDEKADLRPVAKPMDPAKVLAAMRYANAPQGAAGGEVSGLRVKAEQRGPEQGDPLGPYRVAKPEIQEGEDRVYEGMRAGGGRDVASEEGGSEQ